MPPDYTTWLSKQAAADAIGVSTKTVEQLADDGRLEAGLYKRPSGGNRIRVYNPEDVARLAAARRTEPRPFTLATTNDDGTLFSPGDAVARAIAAGGPATDAVARALLAAVLSSENVLGNGPRPATLCVGLREAVTITGLPLGCLRRFVRDGKLEALCRRPLRVRRRDLEGL